MIEKMARVLAVKLSGSEADWQEWTDEAKATLECLKEPTEGMLDARLYGFNHDVEYEQRKDLRPAIFKAMINTALEGK